MFLGHTDELYTVLTELNESNTLNNLTGLFMGYGGIFWKHWTTAGELIEPLIPGDTFTKLVNRFWRAATLAENECVSSTINHQSVPHGK